jgi:hypothetical protein
MDRAVILGALTIFICGLSTIFLRRHAAWGLVGQLTALKAAAAAGFLLSRLPIAGKADLVVVSLIVLGLVPAAGFVGILALQRCGRFGGTLDYDEEDSLRN